MQILATHLTESNKIIFICSVDLVCGVGISGHERSSLIAVHIPSHVPIQKFIFKKIVRTVIFSEGGYTLSRSQNDKTSDILYLVSATSTFALKLVLEWRRLSRFPAKWRWFTREHYLVLRKSRTRSRSDRHSIRRFSENVVVAEIQVIKC